MPENLIDTWVPLYGADHYLKPAGIKGRVGPIPGRPGDKCGILVPIWVAMLIYATVEHNWDQDLIVAAIITARESAELQGAVVALLGPFWVSTDCDDDREAVGILGELLL